MDSKTATSGEINPVAAQIAASAEMDRPTFKRKLLGMTAFALEDGVVHRTYSAYARGLDGV